MYTSRRNCGPCGGTAYTREAVPVYSPSRRTVVSARVQPSPVIYDPVRETVPIYSPSRHLVAGSRVLPPPLAYDAAWDAAPLYSPSRHLVAGSRVLAPPPVYDAAWDAAPLYSPSRRLFTGSRVLAPPPVYDAWDAVPMYSPSRPLVRGSRISTGPFGCNSGCVSRPYSVQSRVLPGRTSLSPGTVTYEPQVFAEPLCGPPAPVVYSRPLSRLAVDCEPCASTRYAMYNGEWPAYLQRPIGQVRDPLAFYHTARYGPSDELQLAQPIPTREFKRIIAVVGATGAQGGSLVQAILEDYESPFKVRAITRNPDSAKAKDLAKRGVEVVAANVDDTASMVEALKGAWGAFFVTNFFEHMSPEREISQASSLARAARLAKVQHVIWSTLEDTRDSIPLSDPRMPTLLGKYKVPHFDAKAEGNKEFIKHGVPTTFLYTSFYWENLIGAMSPKKGYDGKLAITLPMGAAKMPGISTDDIGRCAYGIFKAGREYVGKSVYIAGEHLTGEEMAAALSQALGREIGYNAVSNATYRSFGFPGVDELSNMFQYYHDCEQEFCGRRSVEASRQLNSQLMSFREWLSKNGHRIPLE